MFKIPPFEFVASGFGLFGPARTSCATNGDSLPPTTVTDSNGRSVGHGEIGAPHTAPPSTTVYGCFFYQRDQDRPAAAAVACRQVCECDRCVHEIIDTLHLCVYTLHTLRGRTVIVFVAIAVSRISCLTVVCRRRRCVTDFRRRLVRRVPTATVRASYYASSWTGRPVFYGFVRPVISSSSSCRSRRTNRR